MIRNEAEWYRLEDTLKDSLVFAQDTMSSEGKWHTIPMISSTPIYHQMGGLYPIDYDEAMTSVYAYLRQETMEG